LASLGSEAKVPRARAPDTSNTLAPEKTLSERDMRRLEDRLHVATFGSGKETNVERCATVDGTNAMARAFFRFNSAIKKLG